MSSYTTVYCELADCIFYNRDPEGAGKCRCTHPDKPHYTKNTSCPLYRMDWQKKLRESGMSKSNRRA